MSSDNGGDRLPPGRGVIGMKAGVRGRGRGQKGISEKTILQIIQSKLQARLIVSTTVAGNWRACRASSFYAILNRSRYLSSPRIMTACDLLELYIDDTSASCD